MATPPGASEDLDENRALVAAFLTSLSHDLRTPLGVAAHAVREIKAAPEGTPISAEHLQLLAFAERALRRVGRLADSVSLVAALESGGFELQRRSTDLVALVRDATARASALEPRREVQLACDLRDAKWPLELDPERLETTFTELVVNAIRHARRRVRVRLTEEGGYAHVDFEDDGQGVAASERATLFKRFTGKPARSGLGIGLSLAHDVLVAHGGKLELQDSTLEPGRPGTVGARFVASVPTG